jgi:acyl-CoA synthetase (AMP-forming)/AMP-acid ligase II/alkylation response protein AidB-like acyl-CoA dehydrogenase/acyl carrier protein
VKSPPAQLLYVSPQPIVGPLSIESPGRKANTFTDILHSRAETHADRRAYIFLRDGEEVEAYLTFGQLHRRALGIAERLMALGTTGDRAVLLYPPGLEFIASFFGCMYAGIIPVPASVPNRKRGLEIVRGIAVDSGARWLLSSGPLLHKFQEELDEDSGLRALPRCNTEEWREPSDGFTPVKSEANDVALLQYTSGSTGMPRGVVVTHANLWANQSQIEESFQHDETTVVLSWLPMFHDMGLGTVLQALWLGVQCVLMSPFAFLQKPARWLRAISQYGATSSGGPDFAYDLCVRRIGEEEREGLDLSTWRVAYNGSEPVRAATLARFTEAFSGCGFRRKAFHPVYGLAEATLFVSGGLLSNGPTVCSFSRPHLERGVGELDMTGDGTELVSCGGGVDGRIAIVEPETRKPCSPGQVGEIWVSGPSVAAGYWNKAADTVETFQAQTADGKGPFLRTGDLGFVQSGGLFITGRYKDLIIVRGLNHYPQDIEGTVSQCHPALEPQGSAAWSMEVDDGEQLMIVQEVKRAAVRTLDAEEIFRAIRNVVSEHHGLHTHGIVLLRPSSLPRTSSGKVRRKACRQAFLNGSLPEIAASVFGIDRMEPSADGGTKRRGTTMVPPVAFDATRMSAPRVEGKTPIASRAASADELIVWLRRYADVSGEPRSSDVLRSMGPSLLDEFAQRGLLGMQVGSEHGGLGLGHFETARVIEQLAAIDLNAGLFVGLNNYLGVAPITRHATRRLQSEVLPRLARGGELAGFALAEPEAGSNPEALAAYADPINCSGWRLFGSKHASGGAQRGGFINVFVRHRDREGVTGFVVPREARGVRSASDGLTRGTQGLARNTVTFDGVALSNDHVLGATGQGMPIALEAMAHSRLAVAAACLGGMKRCAQLLFHYATQRQAASGRLVAHPVTLVKLGRVTAGVTALECLVQQLSRATDSGQFVPTEAFSVCKVAAPEMLWQVVDDLVQLLGRRGYVETPHIRNLVRDAQALRSCEGPTEAMSALLGARLMDGGEQAVTTLAAVVLGAPSVAPLVSQAVAAIRARAKKSSAVSPSNAMYWCNARAGELTTWIALLAAVEGQRRDVPNPELERASNWARANIERTLSSIQSEFSLDSSTQDSALTDSVAAYSRSIGDADALLMWSEQSVHPLASEQHTAASEAPPSSRALRSKEQQEGAPSVRTSSPLRDPGPPTTERELKAWVVSWLAQRLRVSERQIDARRSFADHGVDSLTAVELAKALSDQLGRVLDETLLWNFATIDALLEYLMRSAPVAAASHSPAPATGHSEAAPSAVQAEDSLDDEIARLERELGRR